MPSPAPAVFLVLALAFQPSVPAFARASTVPRTAEKEPWPVGTVPPGWGPLSLGGNPTYLRSVAAGGLGAAFAPPLFAWESFLAGVLSPVRMAKALRRREGSGLLDPIRCTKNLFLDAFAVGIGTMNLLTAPLWNLIRPDERTDFMYSRHRLVFFGGPIGGLLAATDYAKGVAPTWHTVFVSRSKKTTRIPPNQNLFEHEFVHNMQIGRSFLWEHVGENYEGFAGWNDADAYSNLNLW